MKAFKESAEKTVSAIWPHPSLCRRSGLAWRPDERNRADVLTSGLQTFLPPSRLHKKTSGKWEFVTRYSGATVLDFHEVPSGGYGWMENHPLTFKEQSTNKLLAARCKRNWWILIGGPNED
jgi:hypothetical protein